MRFLGKFIFYVFSNAIAILAAAYLIAGFEFSGDFKALLIAAVILTLINAFLKPILKLFFGPLILITFGLFIIVINAISLYLLDFWSKSLTIEGFKSLLFATLIVSAVNILINLGAKSLQKKS